MATADCSRNDVSRTQDELRPLFDTMEWAEDEIQATQRRHPKHSGDRIWHSFSLLGPTVELLCAESLYRAHCRELLDRVAQGQDARPATPTECCVALCEISQQVRLSTSATGVYARLWKLAGLPPTHLTDASGHYEPLAASQIDGHEVHLRDKLRHDWRVSPD